MPVQQCLYIITMKLEFLKGSCNSSELLIDTFSGNIYIMWTCDRCSYLESTAVVL